MKNLAQSKVIKAETMHQMKRTDYESVTNYLAAVVDKLLKSHPVNCGVNPTDMRKSIWPELLQTNSQTGTSSRCVHYCKRWRHHTHKIFHHCACNQTQISTWFDLRLTTPTQARATDHLSPSSSVFIFFQLYLKPAVHIFFSTSLFQVFLRCRLPLWPCGACCQQVSMPLT